MQLMFREMNLMYMPHLVYLVHNHGACALPDSTSTYNSDDDSDGDYDMIMIAMVIMI